MIRKLIAFIISLLKGKAAPAPLPKAARLRPESLAEAPGKLIPKSSGRCSTCGALPGKCVTKQGKPARSPHKGAMGAAHPDFKVLRDGPL